MDCESPLAVRHQLDELRRREAVSRREQVLHANRPVVGIRGHGQVQFGVAVAPNGEPSSKRTFRTTRVDPEARGECLDIARYTILESDHEALEVKRTTSAL